MKKRFQGSRILSALLTVLVISTTVFDNVLTVAAIENTDVTVNEAISEETSNDIVMEDVSNGNETPIVVEPMETHGDEPEITEEPGDVSSGNTGVESVSDGNVVQEEDISVPESAGILASGISRGCVWTLDQNGNLVVRDSDGTYGTKDWGWRNNDYINIIKTVDMDISYADSMDYMFEKCSEMVSARVKIDECTGSAKYMFGRCGNLIQLDLNGFNTVNVTDMSFMFYFCESLTTIDVSGFNTENVTDMRYMFYLCKSLTTIDVSGFNTENVTDMSFMFGCCESLTTIDVSRFNTRNVTNMTSMFSRCNRLTMLDVSGFDTQNVTTMGSMFYSCKNLTTIDVSGFDTGKVTSMWAMFQRCSSLTTIDVSGFNTGNVTDMGQMFCDCSSLTTIDVSGFNTEKVKDMSCMFSSCGSLKTLDVSGFNTEKVALMNSMFCGCSSLTTIDVSGFATQNVYDMERMFMDCSSLTTIDVNGFETQNVNSMFRMFKNCSSLNTIDVSEFDTGKVTDMISMFENCSSLTTIDVSGFNTEKVTDMGIMFAGCSNMTTIKTFPNFHFSMTLPVKMYDQDGNGYWEFPQGLSEGIWLARDVKDIPKELSFEKMSYELWEGQTCQLIIKDLPKGVGMSAFTLVSSNPKVAKVDTKGVVTGVAAGRATITASYDRYTAKCTVNILENSFHVTEIEDVTYTGSAIKLEVLVYDDGNLLTEGVDYTLAYANNTVVADKNSKNAPKVTVTGKGNYNGKVVATFTILPYNIKEGGVSVSLPQSVLTANGKVQKPAPVVTFNGKKLTANKDYTVSYPQLAEEGAYKNPGTYDVQVTFKNNFTGTRSLSVEIKEGASISKVKVGAIAKQPYAGSAIEPKPEITMGKETLVEGIHYTLSYANNTLPGKATIKITGMGAYAGEKTVIFEITGTSINKAQVTGLTDKTYNGKIQLQNLKVSLNNGSTYLTEGVDYKLVYEKNLNVGTAKVKIVGAGGYVGTISKSFRILPYNLTTDVDKAITGLPENLVVSYIKGGCKPNLNLMFHAYHMDQKKDCTISYTNNAILGNASNTKAPTITIKGKGNFTGTITIPFTIVANNLSAENTSVKLIVADVAYVNRAGKYVSNPVLMDSNGKKLAAGTDYEKAVIYTWNGKILDPKKDIIPTGSEVTLTVTGKGFYQGTMCATYRITEKSFSSAKITIDKQTYTGKPIQLKAEDIKVVIGKDFLIYGVDYVVVEDSYVNNLSKGNASVTIKGIGKYGGSKTVKFAIIPKGIN